MGWVLERNIVDVNQYTYFFFMNSSVRGPFFPPYLWVSVPRSVPQYTFQL